MDEKNRNLIEIAKKKRYIALVEKVQRGTITSKELKELEAFEDPNDKPKIVDGTVDLPTLALYFEKSPRMIRRYVKQGMPVLRDKLGEISRFNVSEVFKWYYRFQLGVDENDSKDYWDKEYKKNRAQYYETLRKKEEGTLIDFKDHLSIVKNQVRSIKAGFLRLPKHIAPKLYQQDPKVICDMMDEEIRFIINQFAGAGQSVKNSKKDIKNDYAVRG